MQVVELAGRECEFLGSAPTFELAFPRQCGGLVGEGFGVDELDGPRCRSSPAAAARTMFLKTSFQILRGSDVDTLVLQS